MSCDAPSGYKLIYNSITVGDIIVGHVSNWKRQTDIHVRQNFWAPTAILDGRYPSLVWEHNFKVLESEPSVSLYAKNYYQLASTLVTSNPVGLAVISYDNSNVIFHYGSCYLDVTGHEQPDDLLLTAGGIYSLRFLGTSIPTLVNTI